MQVYMNDGLVPLKDAKVSIMDHGFLYGDGIYETLRVYEGVVFMLDEHVRRLEHSAFHIGLNLPKSPDEIKGNVYDTLAANRLRDAYVRLTVSRGAGPVGLDPALCPRPTYIVYAEELKPYPQRFYEEGMSAVIAKTRRNLKEAINPQIKSLNFLNNILAKIEAIKARADEGLMLNHEGYLAEGTVSNVFFVSLRGGARALCTPSLDCGILEGITRDLVIDLAQRNDMKLIEGEFTAEDLHEAEEVFITSTIMEVMPVGKVDEVRFKVGEVTKLLAAEYRKEVAAYVKETKTAGPSLWGYE
jgi:branched-chain amino acid aminotransferase